MTMNVFGIGGHSYCIEKPVLRIHICGSVNPNYDQAPDPAPTQHFCSLWIYFLIIDIIR
jgi:hypothetical protein